MIHFTKIEKKWKPSKSSLKCAECGGRVDTENNYFHLKAYWQIKKKADEKYFCSTRCLNAWSAEDEDHE